MGKQSYKNKKFKILAPTWYEELELRDGSYSISDIQDQFEYIYILKKRGKNSSSFNKNIHHKIENRITFKTKIGYYTELLTPETIKLLRSTKSKITKN